ncbi:MULTISPECIES: hypothetical protein [unclassified Streptomyces]|uniref:hypothetical protein n=1 Tax=unclassified Streptomyces TaxID=2593676 RepID=UPI00380C1F08
MANHRIAKGVGATALALTIGLGGAGDALAWQHSYKTTGNKTQTTGAHHVKKGKRFLTVCIKGNGRTTFTATAYKKVKGKDPKVFSMRHKDKYVCWLTDFKKVSAGKYYVVLKYPKKGKKVDIGVR